LRNHAHAGNGGWYWEVNSLSDLQERILPFFARFPLVGTKARDLQLFEEAVDLLGAGRLTEPVRARVLALREEMNNGGKRRYSMERILRDYTPGSPVEQQVR
jgi:hypothetical protein